MRKVAILAILALLVPGVSQAKSLEDLLVEKGVLTKQEVRAGSHSSNVYWKGGTRLDFPDTGFTARINTQLQPRYEFTDNEFGGNSSSFTLRRARLEVTGTAMNNEFSYRLSSGFAGSSNTTGARTPELYDAYLEWNACDDGSIRMGQFRTAISRQFNTESNVLQFPDRTAASDLFAIGRAQGAQLNWDVTDTVDFSAGIFNGESDGEGGRNTPGIDTNHTAVLALRSDLIGEMNPFVEGDIDHSDLAVNAGVAYSYSDGDNDAGAGLANEDTQRLSVDVNVKNEGWSLHGEFFWASQDNDLVADDSEPVGFYVQAGYHLDEKWEIAARAGQVDCDDGNGFGDCAGLDEITEAGASINYYFWKHTLKAQLAYTYLEDGALAGGTDVETNRIIFQLSAYL